MRQATRTVEMHLGNARMNCGKRELMHVSAGAHRNVGEDARKARRCLQGA
jgi:hypothetical protein